MWDPLRQQTMLPAKVDNVLYLEFGAAKGVVALAGHDVHLGATGKLFA